MGDRIARLMVALPAGISDEEVRSLSVQELGPLDLPKERLYELAEALSALRPPRPQ
jgi:hypothetical protein